MKRPGAVGPDVMNSAVRLLGLLVAVVACTACYGLPEVTTQPSGAVEVAADTTALQAAAATVEPVADVYTTVNAPTDFSILAGAWGVEDYFTPKIEIDAHGAFTSTYYSGEPVDSGVEVPSLVFTGVVRFEDGQYLVEAPSTTSLIPQANLLLVDGYFDYVMQRVEADGSFQPYDPADATRLPPVDSTAVISVSIVDSWTGLSPLAPVESQYELNAGEGGLVGQVFFSVAGYTDPITTTTAISVPLAAWQEALAALSDMPLETGPYLPAFYVTDHYPKVAIVIQTADRIYRFESQSQGLDYVPWRVLVNDQEFVTYSNYPAKVLHVLEPYLARGVLEELMDSAGS